MTLKELGIIVACVFVVSMGFQFSRTWDKVRRELAEDKREMQAILQEVQSIKGIRSQIDAIIKLRQVEGHEIQIVDAYAKRTSGDWCRVGFSLLEDGSERNLYEWNYNIKTKKLFPRSSLARLLIYD